VPLAEQDRSRWDTGLIAEGVEILQAALARDRLGEFQAQAADRGAARRRAHRRGDGLGADRRVVRRARA
jgi:predicted RNA polymerase sigma factor